MIKYKADVNAHTTDDGTFPLYFASMSNYLDVVRVLLENGADPNKATNIKQGHGWTPICVAAMGGHVKAVRRM